MVVPDFTRKMKETMYIYIYIQKLPLVLQGRPLESLGIPFLMPQNAPPDAVAVCVLGRFWLESWGQITIYNSGSGFLDTTKTEHLKAPKEGGLQIHTWHGEKVVVHL